MSHADQNSDPARREDTVRPRRCPPAADEPCFLGIEIGGTKLQLGVGHRESELIELRRLEVIPEHGAAGICHQIEGAVDQLRKDHPIQGIGVGFGGPVQASEGKTITSHQIRGWDDFPLVEWCTNRLDLPTVVGNDCDVAALAEATYGAGRGRASVFYVTAGTGIGGGLVVNGRIQGTDRPAAAEIGHLRPGLLAEHADQTVESMVSGQGIAEAAKARISGDVSLPLTWLAGATGGKESRGDNSRRDSRPDITQEFKDDLLQRCGGDIDRLTAKMIGQAAAEGNLLAMEVVQRATNVLGWAIAQMVTLLAPEIVVVGGGVGLMGESLFLRPVREETARYVFPPLAETYKVVPAALGEAVVVHGAIALVGSTK